MDGEGGVLSPLTSRSGAIPCSRPVAAVCGFGLAALAAAWAAATPPVFGYARLAELGIPVAMLVGVLAGLIFTLARPTKPGPVSRALGVALAGAGLSAVAAYFCLSGLEGPYRAISGGFHGAGLSSALGLVLVTALILIPGFLAGRAAALALRKADAALAVFLVGAAAGTMGSVHLVMPAAGATATMVIGAAALVAAGCVVYFAGGKRRATGGDAVDPTDSGGPSGSTGVAGSTGPLFALGLYCLSLGTLVLVWISVLEQCVGSSAYFRAAVLATVLAAAALGSALQAILARRADGAGGRLGAGSAPGDRSSEGGLGIAPGLVAEAWWPKGLAMGVSGLLWFVPLALENRLPFIFMGFFGSASPGWGRLVAAHFGLALVVFLAPCLVGGATVGAGLRSAIAGRRASSAVTPARLAALLAGLLGACLVHVAAPLAGVTARSMAAAAPWLAVLAGAALVVPRTPSKAWRRAALAAALVGVAAASTAVAPPWNKGIMTGGYAVWTSGVARPGALKGELETADISFYKESAGGVAAVISSADGPQLRRDGLTVGSAADDLASQILAAHIPLAIAQDPKTLLVVGLGTGITLGSAEAHGLIQIDCVEPTAAVAAACRVFAPYNRDALSDSRLRLAICDPANYLVASRARYDIITCGYPLPTPELARLARGVLSPSGMVCEVVDLGSLTGEGFASIARELAYQFPHVSLWWLGGRRVLLAGSMAPLRIDSQTLRRRLAAPKVSKDLERLGTVNYVGMLSLYMMDREAVLGWAADMPKSPRTRDFLRYEAPRVAGTRDYVEVLAALEANRGNPATILTDSEGNTAEHAIVADQIGRCVEARGMYTRALAAIRDRNSRQAATYLESARSNCPENGIHGLQLSDFYLSLSRALAKDKKSVEAMTTARRAVESNPASHRALHNLATLEAKRDPMAAARLLRQATEINPAYLPAQLLEAEAEMAAGLTDQASETIARALSIEPFNARARQMRALCLIERGQLEDARADLAFVLKAEPRNVAALAAAAYTWMLDDQIDKAQQLYEAALGMDSNNLEVLNNLATVYAEKKQYSKAVGMWERALVLAPDNQNIKDNLSEARQFLKESR
jgi:spermidine synthase